MLVKHAAGFACGVFAYMRYTRCMKRTEIVVISVVVLIAFGLVAAAWYLRPYEQSPTVTPEFTVEETVSTSSTTTPGTRTVSLYYYNRALDTDATGNVLCSSDALVPVSRQIQSRTPIQETLTLLLQGELTVAERAQGISTEFPLSGFTLNSVALSSDGLLRIAIADPEHKGTGGSCRTAILAGQIRATALQFPEVKEVEFVPDTLFQP